MNKLISGLVVLLVILAGCSKGPTDEQLKTLLAESHGQLMNKEQAFEVSDSLLALQLAAAAKDFDVTKIEARQLSMFTPYNTFYRSSAIKNWIAPLLAKMSTKQDKDGAVGVYYSMIYNPTADRKAGIVADDYMKLVQHPGFGSMLQDDSLQVSALAMVGGVDAEPAQVADAVKALIPFINSNLSVKNAYQSMAVFDAAMGLGDQMPAEDREALRQAVASQYERIAPLVDEKLKPRVESGVTYLNSLYAQGKLIGSEAPEIDFSWISSGDAKKLSDFKGKVVVVDFWATWCGPCVRSFPNIRELQKRYKGYPVEIIGVTSLQGRHIDRSGEKPKTVDTKENPELEYSLMKDFMKTMDMTWTVAFATQNVFNPEYGVKGIPHVAIIDAEGKVRYNELRPYDAPFHEAEKIDALLKEAGLKYPTKPMDEKNYAE